MPIELDRGPGAADQVTQPGVFSSVPVWLRRYTRWLAEPTAHQDLRHARERTTFQSGRRHLRHGARQVASSSIALRNASGFIQGQASAIFWKDAASNCGDVFFDDGGIPPDFKRLYFEKYIALNPTTTPRFFTEAGEPAATADLIPYDEFLQTRFYLECGEAPGAGRFCQRLSGEGGAQGRDTMCSGTSARA